VGNRVERNRGTGISLLGASKNLIERNLVRDNRRYGILVNAQRDRRFYPSIDNVIRDNVVIGSGVDLVLGGVGNIGNCFEGNRYRTSSPGGLALLQRCGGTRVPLVGNINAFLGTLAERNSLFDPSGDARGGDWWKTVPEPAPQPTMPGGSTAPVVVALHPFAGFPLRLESIPLPEPAERVIAKKVAVNR
jgi:parallel beta-helix repeat protein